MDRRLHQTLAARFQVFLTAHHDLKHHNTKRPLPDRSVRAVNCIPDNADQCLCSLDPWIDQCFAVPVQKVSVSIETRIALIASFVHPCLRRCPIPYAPPSLYLHKLLTLRTAAADIGLSTRVLIDTTECSALTYPARDVVSRSGNQTCLRRASIRRAAVWSADLGHRSPIIQAAHRTRRSSKARSVVVCVVDRRLLIVDR